MGSYNFHFVRNFDLTINFPMCAYGDLHSNLPPITCANFFMNLQLQRLETNVFAENASKCY